MLKQHDKVSPFDA